MLAGYRRGWIRPRSLRAGLLNEFFLAGVAGWALDAYARDRLERLDPEFVKRMDGYKQEAFDRVLKEQQQIKERDRAKDRDRGKDLDRGLER